MSEVDLFDWGHPTKGVSEPKGVSERTKYLWALMGNEWLSFAGPIPKFSLDVGAASFDRKHCSVSLDPFPRGYVDVRSLGESLPFKNGIFRSVVLTSVLKHVLDPVCVLSECFRVLQYGGCLYLTSPINEIDVHRHSFTFRELCNMIEDRGFRILRTRVIGLKYSRLARRLWKYVPEMFAKFPMPSFLGNVLFLVAKRRSED